ncbi:HupE/UreJ family protein [Acinetobacter sp. S40]|uniref:HupE/UreJ family protein n=1 Tax=unclassified Acinetobacter TaxID=196816 RepID=UPI00190D9042|nr:MULTISPECIES: HupE/UreJ family protein [unclassified Acinetobacter]MBJ9985434.1 HupE/UreJ family protein [Acinetobacter sp. S40]MBK0063784.1 HupE/UreJ family protein [Acinetobacter sp. S55]MBK0066927.1 HupE/UreJ family protein [Acinetobacter sp. S54]
MRAFNKQLLVVMFGFLPMITMAHPGHDQTHLGFWEGLIHPFTGLDHLMMAIGFGVLLWTVAKQWRILGILGLSLSLVIGFILGANQIVSASVAEYGIVASLVVLAIALWSRSYRVLPIAAVLMASFHGIAHGVELAPQGHTVGLVLGMISGMTILYVMGLGLGEFIRRYVPYGRKIMAGLAAIVAVVGLT